MNYGFLVAMMVVGLAMGAVGWIAAGRERRARRVSSHVITAARVAHRVRLSRVQIAMEQASHVAPK